MPFSKICVCAVVTASCVGAATSASAATDPDLLAGDIIQIAAPVAALGATWHYHDADGRWQFLKSFGLTLVATYALKGATKNTAWGERPNGGTQSFPSGHTASACSAGFFMAERYGWAWGAPAIAAAVYTGYTRVDERAHHIRDVVAGCALAYGVSKLFVTKMPERLALGAEAGKGNVSLSMSFRY